MSTAPVKLFRSGSRSPSYDWAAKFKSMSVEELAEWVDRINKVVEQGIASSGRNVITLDQFDVKGIKSLFEEYGFKRGHFKGEVDGILMDQGKIWREVTYEEMVELVKLSGGTDYDAGGDEDTHITLGGIEVLSNSSSESSVTKRYTGRDAEIMRALDTVQRREPFPGYYKAKAIMAGLGSKNKAEPASSSSSSSSSSSPEFQSSSRLKSSSASKSEAGCPSTPRPATPKVSAPAAKLASESATEVQPVFAFGPDPVLEPEPGAMTLLKLESGPMPLGIRESMARLEALGDALLLTRLEMLRRDPMTSHMEGWFVGLFCICDATVKILAEVERDPGVAQLGRNSMRRVFLDGLNQNLKELCRVATLQAEEFHRIRLEPSG